MLKSNRVNLRLMEREDLPLLREWVNDPDFVGEFEPISQETQRDLEKQYDALTEGQWFFIEKKDGTKIGYVAHFLRNNRVELGYTLVPKERGKGYGTEAVKIAVDYVFLSKSTMRIQAETDPENAASQRILQKTGFRKEGVIRKSFFCRGEWRDTALFSILRDEWKEPRIIGKHRMQNKPTE